MAIYFDNNDQIFPSAFGVGDLENKASYMWFFKKFKETYDDVKGLAFIIDKYKGLERAIAKIPLRT